MSLLLSLSLSPFSTLLKLMPHCNLVILHWPSVPNIYDLKSNRITKVIRNYRSINLTSFSNDILSSALFFSPPPTSLQSYLHLFNSTLLSILDNHAPLKTVTCPARPKKTFYHSRNSFSKI